MSSSTSKSITSLAGQSIGYGLGVFGRQLVIYLTIPFFTNHMSRAEFGLVSFAMAIMGFVNVLTTAGLHAAIFRLYHDSDELDSKRNILGSSLLMLTIFAALPALGFLLYANPIAQSFLGSLDYVPVIQLAAMLLVVDTLVNYGYVLLRIQIRPLATSLSNVWIVVAQMVSALVFVYIYDWGAVGYLTGLLLGEALGLLLLTFLTRRLISLRVSRPALGALLRYGLPLLPAALAMWALQLADRALIGGIAGLDQLAIYEIGYKMGALVALAIGPFRTAWPPFAFSVMRSPNAKVIYRDVLTYLLFIALFLTLGIVAFKSEILHLLAPASYAAALSVVGWVALAQVFLSSHLVLSIGPKISKRTFDLTIATVFAAVVYLALMIVFIPRMGIVGAAIATTIGYGVLAFGSYRMGQRSYPFPLDWVRLLKLALAASASYLLISVIDRAGFSGWEYYLGKAGAWLSFLLVSLLVGVVTVSQLRNLWRSVFRMLKTRSRGASETASSTLLSRP